LAFFPLDALIGRPTNGPGTGAAHSSSNDTGVPASPSEEFAMSMHRALLVPLALLLALLVGLSSPAQDKEKKKKDPNDDKPAAKLTGPLPAHFKKLGLSDKQKQEVLKIMADARAKVAQLQKEIKDTRAKARKDAEAVLTPDQRKLLRKLKTGDE